ncbi:MAG: hypothetical protein RI907_2645, partial [Pseudomonadota bacterium]
MAEAQSPNHQAPHDQVETRVLFWIAILASVATLSTWSYCLYLGRNTSWDLWAAPCLAAVFIGSALALHLMPRLTQAIAIGCLAAASAFWLGSTYHSAHQLGEQGWLSLTAVSQFAPLLYVAAFITLKRGAATFSWMHYLGLLALYGLLVHSPWRAREPDHVTQIWWLSVIL